MTKEELSKRDGKDGRAAYVACEGKVFDVTNSFLWRGGNHQVLHDAGQDLTESLKHAQHGLEMLDRFRIVGPAETFDPDNV